MAASSSSETVPHKRLTDNLWFWLAVSLYVPALWLVVMWMDTTWGFYEWMLPVMFAFAFLAFAFSFRNFLTLLTARLGKRQGWW